MDSKLCVGCAEHDSKIKQRAGCMRECCEKRRLYGQVRVVCAPFKASSSDQTLLQWTRELSPGSGDYFVRFYSWRFRCTSNERTISVCISIQRPIHEADLSALGWDVPILHLSCFIKRQISTWTPLFYVYDSRGACECACPLVEWLIKKTRNCLPFLSTFTF